MSQSTEETTRLTGESPSAPLIGYVCACGYKASAHKTPFGWMVACWDTDDCGNHTANNHQTIELAEKAWIEMGGSTHNTELSSERAAEPQQQKEADARRLLK
jgi:hypothetical protein